MDVYKVLNKLGFFEGERISPYYSYESSVNIREIEYAEIVTSWRHSNLPPPSEAEMLECWDEIEAWIEMDIDEVLDKLGRLVGEPQSPYTNSTSYDWLVETWRHTQQSVPTKSEINIAWEEITFLDKQWRSMGMLSHVLFELGLKETHDSGAPYSGNPTSYEKLVSAWTHETLPPPTLEEMLAAWDSIKEWHSIRVSDVIMRLGYFINQSQRPFLSDYSYAEFVESWRHPIFSAPTLQELLIGEEEREAHSAASKEAEELEQFLWNKMSLTDCTKALIEQTYAFRHFNAWKNNVLPEMQRAIDTYVKVYDAPESTRKRGSK